MYEGQDSYITWSDVWSGIVVLCRLGNSLLQMGGVDTELRLDPLLEQGQLLPTPYRVSVTHRHTGSDLGQGQLLAAPYRVSVTHRHTGSDSNKGSSSPPPIGYLTWAET